MKSRIVRSVAAMIFATLAAIWCFAERAFDSASAGKNLPPDSAAAQAGHEPPARDEARLGDLTFAQRIGRSSLIVRARLLKQTTETRQRTSWDVEAGWDIRITKVLYGEPDSEVMNVILGEPVENLGTFKSGMELTMFFATIEGQYRLRSTMLGASEALDERILKVIATGAHLPAGPEPRTQLTTAGRRTLAQRVAGASLIVRGKFLEKPQVIPDKLGLWKKVRWNVRIIKVLYGKADSEVIRVLTCELPEQYKHLSPNPRPIEPGAEAILFLRVAQYQDAGMSFDDPNRTGRALDAVEQQLREVIESGDHLRVTPEPDNFDGVYSRL